MLIKRFVILTIGIVLIASCKNKESGTDKEAQESQIGLEDGLIRIAKDQFNSRGMEFASADSITVREEIGTQGYIDVPPESRALVSAPMPGFIKHAPLIVGDKVKRGQQLISLENPDFVTLQQAYLEALAQQDFLKAEFERQKTLYEEQVSSRKSFMLAESEFRKNSARLSSLEAQLQLLRVRAETLRKDGIRSHLSLLAPISGSITRVMVSLGMYTPPNQPLLEIINTEHLHLELGIFEQDAMKIRIGQRIRFYRPEQPSEVFDGEVYKVGNLVDQETRTVRIHGHIPSSLIENFAIGTYVQAEIIAAEQQAVALPDEALIREGETTYTLVLSEEQDEAYFLKKVQVAAGISKEGMTQILSPDPELMNAQFLVRGAYWFRTDGD